MKTSLSGNISDRSVQSRLPFGLLLKNVKIKV
jgi:hypothetical protein